MTKFLTESGIKTLWTKIKAGFLSLKGGTVSGDVKVVGQLTMGPVNGVPVFIANAPGVYIYRDTTTTGSVAIGGATIDSKHKFSVKGNSLFTGNVTCGDISCGTINSSRFGVDADGWVQTDQINVGDGNNPGSIVVYDSSGNECVLNIDKAVELGVFDRM